jgi:Cytochrome c2
MSRLFACSLALALLSAFVGDGAAAADAEAGKKVFNKCAACHSIEPGKVKVGPSMWGIVGRKAGTQEGYSYSAAMKESGITWDAATLKAYLAKPSSVVKGTKMAFVGISNPTEVDNLIAYLETLK